MGYDDRRPRQAAHYAVQVISVAGKSGPCLHAFRALAATLATQAHSVAVPASLAEVGQEVLLHRVRQGTMLHQGALSKGCFPLEKAGPHAMAN